VAKATKNKKNNKEGRHVGLDFYDLLIEEELIDLVLGQNPRARPPVTRMFSQQKIFSCLRLTDPQNEV
jgi:hypothetical protein